MQRVSLLSLWSVLLHRYWCNDLRRVLQSSNCRSCSRGTAQLIIHENYYIVSDIGYAIIDIVITDICLMTRCKWQYFCEKLLTCYSCGHWTCGGALISKCYICQIINYSVSCYKDYLTPSFIHALIMTTRGYFCVCIYTQYISIYENINVLIQKLFLRDFSKNQPKLQCGNFALINWYSLQKETDNVSLLMHNAQ